MNIEQKPQDASAVRGASKSEGTSKKEKEKGGDKSSSSRSRSREKKHSKKSSKKSKKSKKSNRSPSKTSKRRSPSSSRSSSSSSSSRSSSRSSYSSDRSSRHRKRSKKEHRHSKKSSKHHRRSRRSRSKSRSNRRSSRSPPRRPFRRLSPTPPHRVKPQKIDPSKKNLFWNGYQWVAKINSVAAVDQNYHNLVTTTRKMRRVQISNLPLYLGLGERDISQIVQNYILENYLNDPGNSHPVLACEVNPQFNTANIELSSVEETEKFIKIGSLKIFDQNCKIMRLGDNFNQPVVPVVQANAQTTAQAHAAALQAMQLIQNKNTGGVLLKTQTLTPPSRVLKIHGFLEPEHARFMPDGEMDDMLEDLTSEFMKSGSIIDAHIVKGKVAIIGAEAGCVFIKFGEKDMAEKAMKDMFGKKFNKRELKMVFIPEETYDKHFAHLR